MYVALTYDPEAVCGSFDACLAAHGPYETWEQADDMGEMVAGDNGLSYEVLTLSIDEPERRWWQLSSGTIRDILLAANSTALLAVVIF